MRLSRLLRQNIVYWGNPVHDGLGGHTWDDGVEIVGRWEDKQELYLDRNGSEKVSDAIVYLSQSVDLGGFLYLGTLDDFSSSAPDPQDHIEAKEIRAVTKSPDVKGTTFLYKAIL